MYGNQSRLEPIQSDRAVRPGGFSSPQRRPRRRAGRGREQAEAHQRRSSTRRRRAWSRRAGRNLPGIVRERDRAAVVAEDRIEQAGHGTPIPIGEERRPSRRRRLFRKPRPEEDKTGGRMARIKNLEGLRIRRGDHSDRIVLGRFPLKERGELADIVQGEEVKPQGLQPVDAPNRGAGRRRRTGEAWLARSAAPAAATSSPCAQAG